MSVRFPETEKRCAGEVRVYQLRSTFDSHGETVRYEATHYDLLDTGTHEDLEALRVKHKTRRCS